MKLMDETDQQAELERIDARLNEIAMKFRLLRREWHSLAQRRRQIVGAIGRRDSEASQ